MTLKTENLTAESSTAGKEGTPDTASCTIEATPNETGSFLLKIAGRVDITTSTALIREISSKIKPKKTTSITVDLSDIQYFDDFGALVLIEIKHLLIKNPNSTISLVNVPQKVEEILALIDYDGFDTYTQLDSRNGDTFIARVGDSAIEVLLDIRFFVSYMGSVIMAFLHVFTHPRSLRVGDVVTCMEKTGVNALPIVGLISFLLGAIMAFMSSMQLQQFGANIYVASLVSLAMVSELGPIMTAIIVSGRSGSAFAAEIATMKISEEVDALFTMGYSPTVFLTVPKIVATIIVVPLLTLFSDIFAVAGGLFVGVGILDLTPGAYINQTLKTLTLFEVSWGLSKSVAFAFIIAWIGCLKGFRARGGPASVGEAATSAVVGSIFFIILFDSLFAIMRSSW